MPRRLPLGTILFLTATVSLPPVDRVSAQEATTSPGRFSGHASGTAVHADGVRVAVGGPALLHAAVAVAGASVDSEGLDHAIVDEMEQVVQPAAGPDKKSYARGTGLEVSVAESTPYGRHLVTTDPAEAAAPPSSPSRTGGVSVGAGPLALASMAGAEAQPVWSNRTCVIGQPMSFASGSASGVHRQSFGPLPVDLTDQPLLQSRSFSYLRPNRDGTFALVSETRQSFAPVTLLPGSTSEVTIELLGEWVLRATASGKRDGAEVEYGPVGKGPATPVVRLTFAGGVTELNLQELLGTRGVVHRVHPLLAVAVGEHPRPIAAPGRAADPTSPPEESSDGTRAAAAVDVVRVTLLEPVPADAPSVAEVRLGHMEARAVVPPGGVSCPMPISKAGSPAFVNPGENFTWTISIPSASDAFEGLSCDLVNVRAVDTVRAARGVAYTVVSASNGGLVDEPTVTWENLGRYRPGAHPIVLTVNGRVEPTSAKGFLTDTVEVTASLANCTGGAAGQQLVDRLERPIALRGSFTLNGPMVLPGNEGDGTEDGGSSPILGALAVGAFALRRIL